MENRVSELLTIDEIAQELRVSKNWVYARTRHGQAGIPHLKLGKQLRFKKEEVMKFFDNQRQKVNV